MDNNFKIETGKTVHLLKWRVYNRIEGRCNTLVRSRRKRNRTKYTAPFLQYSAAKRTLIITPKLWGLVIRFKRNSTLNNDGPHNKSTRVGLKFELT